MKPSSVFQTILLAVFGASAVAGILIFAFLVGSNSAGTIGEVTVWGPFDEDAVSTVLRQLMDQDDRLKQVTYVQKSPESFTQELTNALASGTGPDLFILDSEHTVVDASKILAIPYETLSREQYSDLFVEGANVFLSPEGVLGVPLAVNPMVMYWNRDMFANAGLAQPPAYWDELYAMSRAMTQKSDSGIVTKSTVAFGEFANVSHAKAILSTLIMQAGGTITGRDRQGALVPGLIARNGESTQPTLSALQFFAGFANPANDYYSWNRSRPQSREAFAAGDLAVYIGYASEEPLLRTLNPNLNFAVAAMPQVRGSARAIDGGIVYALVTPRAAKNPAGGQTAAYLLGSPEASRKLSAVLGYVSARRDALAAPLQGNDDLYRRQALIVKTWEDPNPVETEAIFRGMIESVTSGAASVQSAVQRAEDAMRELLGV